MGFSTSAVVVIFTVSLIYMASMFYPLAEISYHNVLEAEKNSYELRKEKLDTKIVITNWNKKILTVSNNGSITLNSSKINVMLNGELTSSFSVNPTGVWPAKTSIDVNIGVQNGKVKVIADNGAADSIEK